MLQPPFTGYSDIQAFDIMDIIKSLDLHVLFKSRWKMGRGGEEMLADLLEDERILPSMRPRGIYGYFPAERRGHKILLAGEFEWEFPELKGRVLSEYFRSQDEGGDFIPLTAVTIGPDAVQLSKILHANNDYAEYFLYYGLAAECTDAIASMLNDKINKELGVSKTLRRSFGYPACPDLSYQVPLLDLLKADRIGISLNEGNQLVPEFSTTAFLIHSGFDH